uniref:Uncharacterized protein n=1 Tax=Staphylothermus marinus TaxID=2280 RepID=A0A7C4HCM2_STAMA
MEKKEDKKRKIIDLIDKSNKQGPKIAFYSDQHVSSLMNELYKRWKDNGERGIPLDYATDNEIESLYNMAVKYSNVTDEEAWISFLCIEDSGNTSLGNMSNRDYRKALNEKESIWKKIFRFIIPG